VFSCWISWYSYNAHTSTKHYHMWICFIKRFDFFRIISCILPIQRIFLIFSNWCTSTKNTQKSYQNNLHALSGLINKLFFIRKLLQKQIVRPHRLLLCKIETILTISHNRLIDTHSTSHRFEERPCLSIVLLYVHKIQEDN